jgi:hypothetical protein
MQKRRKIYTCRSSEQLPFKTQLSRKILRQLWQSAEQQLRVASLTFAKALQ